MCILNPQSAKFSVSVDVAIIGAGACGYTAALAASDQGANVAILERDPTPLGSTAMSTGLIPGANTRFQREAGIEDSSDLFRRDILCKTRNQTDTNIVDILTRESAPTIEWLADTHHIPLSLVESFLYPGHSVMRLHGTPNRNGSGLMTALFAAGERAGINLLTSAVVNELFADADGTVHGVRVDRPDGSRDDIACRTLVLACSGYGGNSEMLKEYVPEMLNAEFFGHAGNKGDAIRWGRAMGASIRDIGAYQGHGGLAAGYSIPILWPLIMEGGIQVNKEAKRFSNEALGYSEQATHVIAQPGHVAFDIFDERLHRLMLEFQDYRDAYQAGAIVSAASPSLLAKAIGVPESAFIQSLSDVEQIVHGKLDCPFGRKFKDRDTLTAPFYAAKVKGALFHTQGGLEVDEQARVQRKDGGSFPNLFAGGGAARGISGPGGWGYLAGNGLLTATTLGRIAGKAAAELVCRD
jgi:fumarate reductase flavoprotein subunit